MNVTYEHKQEMTLIGFSTSIRPEEGYIKCPEFWVTDYSQKYSRLWKTMIPETPVEKAILDNLIGMFAICEQKEDCFEYWIAGIYLGGEVPEGLKLYTFPESDWAMFSAKGALPKSLQDLNTKVLREWYPKYGRKYRASTVNMLEVYSGGNMQSPDYECEIWIPVTIPEDKTEHETAEMVSTMTVTGILKKGVYLNEQKECHDPV